MKYFVTIGDQTIEVELDGNRALVGGDEVEVHFAAVPGTPLHHLLLAGASWTVAAEQLEARGSNGRWALGIVGERIEVEVVDERTRQIERLTGTRAAPPAGGVVKAPMPGLVVRVVVTEGQRVDAGAALVVVEAMKMENELRAAHAGLVAKVHVAVGDAVEKGAPLVTLKNTEA